jgi:hypothetical protein
VCAIIRAASIGRRASSLIGDRQILEYAKAGEGRRPANSLRDDAKHEHAFRPGPNNGKQARDSEGFPLAVQGGDDENW